MRADQIIAGAIVEMAKTKFGVGFIKDISQYIYDHKHQGRDVSGVTLQRTPLGFHSPEVAEFVGRLVTTGLATQSGPVIITPEGVKWLKNLSSGHQELTEDMLTDD